MDIYLSVHALRYELRAFLAVISKHCELETFDAA